MESLLQGQKLFKIARLVIQVIHPFLHLRLEIRTVVLEKTLESHWDSKIKPVSPKGNQP